MYHVGHFMARLLDVSYGTLHGQATGCIIWNTSWSGYWMYHVEHFMARLMDVSYGTLHGQDTGCIT
jgi:hypothetical protein